MTPGASGATLDIGTTSGGSDIASGIPLDGSADSREYFDYTHVEFSAGDEIHFTASVAAAEYNPRYTVGANTFNYETLNLATRGPTKISNCNFVSPPKQLVGIIYDEAINAKKYSLSNCTFNRVGADDLGWSDTALWGTTDDGTEDPIRRCAIFDSISNLTPAH